MPKRILIIGCPGTGKSTFATQLAKQTGLPVFHLDKDWHEEGRWSNELDTKRQQWRQHIAELLKKPEWIMDGNYTSTLDIRIPMANVVVFLDYPTVVALWGVVKRRFQQQGLGRRPDMPDGWQEKLNSSLIKKVIVFKHSHKPRIMNHLQENPGVECVVLKNRRQLKELL